VEADIRSSAPRGTLQPEANSGTFELTEIGRRGRLLPSPVPGAIAHSVPSCSIESYIGHRLSPLSLHHDAAFTRPVSAINAAPESVIATATSVALFQPFTTELPVWVATVTKSVMPMAAPR